MSPTCNSRTGLNMCSALKLSVVLDSPGQRYSTDERIEGKVLITVDAETKFSEINISLEGPPFC